MLISYPGSKDAQMRTLLPRLKKVMGEDRAIAEPFAGTAALTFSLLRRKEVDRYWINDVDESLISLWKIIRAEPKELIKKVISYEPNVDDFYNYKKDLGKDDLEKAFKKLVLHQISAGGLGAKAANPLGGKNQLGKTLVGSKWNPDRLKTKISQCSSLLNSAEGKITSVDWSKITEVALMDGFSLYLDPPLVSKGKAMYIKDSVDHDDLAELLRSKSFVKWILSYDDVPLVRDLYNWTNIEIVKPSSSRKKIGDIIVSPPTPAW